MLQYKSSMHEHMLEASNQESQAAIGRFFVAQDRLPLELPPPAPTYALRYGARPAAINEQPHACERQLVLAVDATPNARPIKIKLGSYVKVDELLENAETYTELTDSGKLSAKEEVTKQLAIAKIMQTIAPIVHERYYPVLPNGLYRLGEHIYRRDNTGVYLASEDSQGKQTYKTMATFIQPVRYAFASNQSWVDLARDLINNARIEDSVRQLDVRTNEGFSWSKLAQERPNIEKLKLDPETVRRNREQQEELRRANGYFAHAYLFWLSNRDLLPEGVGKIMNLNLTPDGVLTTDEIEQGLRLTLHFDAREAKTGNNIYGAVYKWRLKTTDLQTNIQTVDECTIEQGKSAQCLRRSYDFQWRLMSTEIADSVALMPQVIAIVADSATKEYFAERRRQLESLREKLGDFALAAATNPTAKPYEQQDLPGYQSALDKQRQKIQSATFMPESGSA